MISANGGLPAHRYTPQVTQRWPRGSEPASEGKVGQQLHFPNVLRPETLPKRLKTRQLQAVTSQVPVRETIMRWCRHRGMDLPEEYMRCHCGRELEM